MKTRITKKHKEMKKHINMQTNEKIVTQSAKLVKQMAIHSLVSSHSQAVKQTVTQSSKLLLFDSNKQSDRTITRSINQSN